MSDLNQERIEWLEEMDKFWLDTHADLLREELGAGNGVKSTSQLVTTFVQQDAKPGYVQDGPYETITSNLCPDCGEFAGMNHLIVCQPKAIECEPCDAIHLPGEHTVSIMDTPFKDIPKRIGRKKPHERIQDSYEYNRARNWLIISFFGLAVCVLFLILALTQVMPIGVGVVAFIIGLIDLGIIQDAIPDFYTARRRLRSNKPEPIPDCHCRTCENREDAMEEIYD